MSFGLGHGNLTGSTFVVIITSVHINVARSFQTLIFETWGLLTKNQNKKESYEKTDD